MHIVHNTFLLGVRWILVRFIRMHIFLKSLLNLKFNIVSELDTYMYLLICNTPFWWFVLPLSIYIYINDCLILLIYYNIFFINAHDLYSWLILIGPLLHNGNESLLYRSPICSNFMSGVCLHTLSTTSSNYNYMYMYIQAG